MKGKSIIAWILGIVILAAIIIGTVFIVNSCNKEKAGDGIATYSEVEYFDEIQIEGNVAVVRAYAVGENFTSITYQLDNNAEVKVNGASVGDATDEWEKYENEYKDLRYIDTRVITIDLSELEAGDHILKIYVYDGEEKEIIYKSTFEIKKATATV